MPKRQKLSQDAFTTNQKTQSTNFHTPAQKAAKISDQPQKKKRIEKLIEKNGILLSKLREQKLKLKETKKDT